MSQRGGFVQLDILGLVVHDVSEVWTFGTSKTRSPFEEMIGKPESKAIEARRLTDEKDIDASGRTRWSNELETLHPQVPFLGRDAWGDPTEYLLG